MQITQSAPADNSQIITIDSTPCEISSLEANNVRSMSNDELGNYVQSSVLGILRRAEELRPYYEELWGRFDDLKDGETICGCTTRTQFCSDILNRSIRSVQHALYGRAAAQETPYPKYEYIEDFISGEEGAELVRLFESSQGWQEKETGSCTVPPSHATIHWGPRQAYLDCVPTDYRAKSAGDIPNFLLPLQKRLEKQYGCVFNSAQINKHFNQDAVVHAHTDSNAGHICMISIGAERDFVLKSFAHGRKEFARLKQGSGSLLTFFPKEQHKHTHEMPKSKEPCGVRYSIIFRHIQPVLTIAGNLTKKVNGTTKEKKAIRDQREFEYLAAQNGEPPTEEERVKAAAEMGKSPEQIETFEEWTDRVTKEEGRTFGLHSGNMNDTRHISMALYRFSFMAGKVRLLGKELGGPNDEVARRVLLTHLDGCAAMHSQVLGMGEWITRKLDEVPPPSN